MEANWPQLGSGPGGSPLSQMLSPFGCFSRKQWEERISRTGLGWHKLSGSPWKLCFSVDMKVIQYFNNQNGFAALHCLNNIPAEVQAWIKSPCEWWGDTCVLWEPCLASSVEMAPEQTRRTRKKREQGNFQEWGADWAKILRWNYTSCMWETVVTSQFCVIVKEM